MPKACCTSNNLVFKLKIVATAEAIENNLSLQGNTASVSQWFVADGKTKKTSSMAKHNCPQNIKRWAVLHQSVLRWIKDCWNGFVKSRGESCENLVYMSLGIEHSHWPVFDNCQNISIIAYLFYLSPSFQELLSVD